MFHRVFRPVAARPGRRILLWPQAERLAAQQSATLTDVGMHAALDVVLDTYVREGLVYYRALRSERGRLDAYISNLDVPAASFERWSSPSRRRSGSTPTTRSCCAR